MVDSIFFTIGIQQYGVKELGGSHRSISNALCNVIHCNQNQMATPDSEWFDACVR